MLQLRRVVGADWLAVPMWRRAVNTKMGICNKKGVALGPSGSRASAASKLPRYAHTRKVDSSSAERSVGSVGNSYDNALAESVNALYKTKVIRTQGPWRTIEDVETATLVRVD